MTNIQRRNIDLVNYCRFLTEKRLRISAIYKELEHSFYIGERAACQILRTTVLTEDQKVPSDRVLMLQKDFLERWTEKSTCT